MRSTYKHLSGGYAKAKFEFQVRDAKERWKVRTIPAFHSNVQYYRVID